MDLMEPMGKAGTYSDRLAVAQDTAVPHRSPLPAGLAWEKNRHSPSHPDTTGNRDLPIRSRAQYNPIHHDTPARTVFDVGRLRYKAIYKANG
jgi:hypothetical protein